MSDACKKHPRLFGSSVSISNKLVLVGAPAIGHRGKVYTYLIKSSTKTIIRPYKCIRGS